MAHHSKLVLALVLWVSLISPGDTQCCGVTNTDPCPCQKDDWNMASRCGCASCPAGYYGASCSGTCDCHQGECTHPSGGCRCFLGWAGLACDEKIPSVTSQSVSLTNCLAVQHTTTCPWVFEPFILSLTGIHFSENPDGNTVLFRDLKSGDELDAFDVTYLNTTSTRLDVSVIFNSTDRPRVFTIKIEVVSDGVTSNTEFHFRFGQPTPESAAQFLYLIALTPIAPSVTGTLSDSLSQSGTESLSETDTMTSSESATLTVSETSSMTAAGTITASPTGSNTPTRSPTHSVTHTAPSTDTVTKTDTLTPTATLSGTDTLAVTVTPSSTATATPTGSRSLTATTTHSGTPSGTLSTTATQTVSLTDTLTDTITPTSLTVTTTPSSTPSLTLSPTVTVSVTISGTESATDTTTSTPSATDTFSITQSATVSGSQSTTATSTTTATASLTETLPVTPTLTLSVSQTTTLSESATDSATLSSTETVTMSESASETSSSSDTVTVTDTTPLTATESHTPSLTATETASLSAIVTPSETPTTTLSLVPTGTETFTETFSRSPTLSMSISESVTLTEPVTATTTHTLTETMSLTPSSTPSLSTSLTATDISTSTNSATAPVSPTGSASLSATHSATESASVTDSPTSTPQPTSSVTLSLTSTSTASPTVTATRRATASPTPSPSLSATPVPTASLTTSATWTTSDTPTSTSTPSSTFSVTVSRTTSASRTTSSSVSASDTPTPIPTPTRSPSILPTLTPTATSTPSDTPTPTTSLTVSHTASSSLSASETPTPIPTPTHSSSIIPTPTSTSTPSKTPVPTPTSAISLTVSRTASASRTASLSLSASDTPSLIPTPTPSSSIIPTPSSSSTLSDTASPFLTATVPMSSTPSHSTSRTPAHTATLSPTPSDSVSATRSTSHSLTHTSSASATGAITISATESLSVSRSESATESLSLTLTDSPTLLRTECPQYYHHPPHCECGLWYSDDVCNCALRECPTCIPGYYGATCEAQCASTTCSGRGVCDDGPSGTGQCVCEPPWHGAVCAVREPEIASFEVPPCRHEAAFGRFSCRAPPSVVRIHGAHFDITTNVVLDGVDVMCTEVRTVSEQLLHCVLPSGSTTSDFDMTVSKTVGMLDVTSKPVRLSIRVETQTATTSVTPTASSTPTVTGSATQTHTETATLTQSVSHSLSLTATPSGTNTPSETLPLTVTPSVSVTPVCILAGWLGVQCTCRGAEFHAICGIDSPFHTDVCEDPLVVFSPAPAAAGGAPPAPPQRECHRYRRCVRGVYLPHCLCLESPDGAWCSDGNPLAADGRCTTGACVSQYVCSVERGISHSCTCTNAEKNTPCNWDWLCDGRGECVEKLEDLAVEVKPSEMNTDLAVPVVVGMTSGDLPADEVSLSIEVGANTSTMAIATPPSCSVSTTAEGNYAFICPQGNLGAHFSNTVRLMMRPMGSTAGLVPITARLSSVSMTRVQKRHYDTAVAVVPLADITVSSKFAELTDSISIPFVLENHGPGAALNVSIQAWVIGSLATHTSHYSVGFGSLAPGEKVDEEFSVGFLHNVSIRSAQVRLLVKSGTLDPTLDNNMIDVDIGPFYMGPPARWQDPPVVANGTPPFVLEYYIVSPPDPVEILRGKTVLAQLYLVAGTVLFAVGVWLVESCHPVHGVRARLQAHTMWSQPTCLASAPLKSVDELYSQADGVRFEPHLDSAEAEGGAGGAEQADGSPKSDRSEEIRRLVERLPMEPRLVR